MPQRILTQRGDVLILRTEQSFMIHVVGVVSEEGQQDFKGQTNLVYEPDRAKAVAAAKALAGRGQRILLRNLDTDAWTEYSD